MGIYISGFCTPILLMGIGRGVGLWLNRRIRPRCYICGEKVWFSPLRFYHKDTGEIAYEHGNHYYSTLKYDDDWLRRPPEKQLELELNKKRTYVR